MPPAKTGQVSKARGQGRRKEPVADQRAKRNRSPSTSPRLKRKARANRPRRRQPAAFVLVPIDEYERLTRGGMLASALDKLNDDEGVVDADEFALELAGQRIAKARKAAGLTQVQLGKKLNLPQSQISRIERNPDRTTVRTLKRIARALGVSVSALV